MRDARENFGYSFSSKEERDAFRAFILDAEKRLEEEGLSRDVLFHGISTAILEDILRDGLRPTDISEATVDEDLPDMGTFWGTIATAAYYAEDCVAERHQSGHPAFVCISAAKLIDDCILMPDGATIDFPPPGLTRLEEPGVHETWQEAAFQMSWRDALRDLGAIIAVHDFYIPPEDFVIIKNSDDLERFIQNVARPSLQNAQNQSFPGGL